MSDADQALSLDESYLAAMVVRAQLLSLSRRYDAAYDVTSRIIERSPRDPFMLFLHARIAHQAHAFQSEIGALKTLVELAQKDGAPVTGYRIYLAQAYAASGDAQPSLEQFNIALADDSISADQRAYIVDSIARIRSRAATAPLNSP